MIDLHCHILPGIDDGVENLDAALAMARQAVERGITACVATPHIHPGRYDNEAESIRRIWEDFCAQLAGHGIPLTVRMAAEVRLTPELIEWVPEGRIPYLGTWEGKPVLLLELPHSHVPPGTTKFLAWLKRRGIQVLLAHPERNKTLMRNPDKLGPLLESGCLAQLTAASVTGAFGPWALAAAEYFLDRNWVFVVATDAHNLEHRPPILDAAYQRLMESRGEDLARLLCCDNPNKLLS